MDWENLLKAKNILPEMLSELQTIHNTYKTDKKLLLTAMGGDKYTKVDELFNEALDFIKGVEG
tara:strand:- start:91 stop:279 length:189 start_codon:yes stop_codon:yes gene_type:complete